MMRVTHYKSSGRVTPNRTLCGRVLQPNSNNRVTASKDHVTCKLCLREIAWHRRVQDGGKL